LIHDDSEEMQRIHRVCGALEAAAFGAPVQSAGEGGAAKPAVAVFRRADISPPPAAVDMSALLKEHRLQRGACALCGEAVTRRSAQKHLASCAPARDLARGPEQRLMEIRTTAPGLPAYWLDIEVKADAKLDALDSFLRDIWLECCGHLSAFRIDTTGYFSRGYDFGFTKALGSLGGRRAPERSMSVKICDALPSSGEPFEYEYDFGSTTMLQLKVMRERTGRPGRPPVRLLVRNTPPRWPCAICGEPAMLVCAYCVQGETTHSSARNTGTNMRAAKMRASARRELPADGCVRVRG
jgi:hypothetical protein